jgi:hypothetical protein
LKEKKSFSLSNIEKKTQKHVGLRKEEGFLFFQCGTNLNLCIYYSSNEYKKDGK